MSKLKRVLRGNWVRSSVAMRRAQVLVMYLNSGRKES